MPFVPTLDAADPSNDLVKSLTVDDATAERICDLFERLSIAGDDLSEVAVFAALREPALGLSEDQVHASLMRITIAVGYAEMADEYLFGYDPCFTHVELGKHPETLLKRSFLKAVLVTPVSLDKNGDGDLLVTIDPQRLVAQAQFCEEETGLFFGRMH